MSSKKNYQKFLTFGQGMLMCSHFDSCGADAILATADLFNATRQPVIRSSRKWAR